VRSDAAASRSDGATMAQETLATTSKGTGNQTATASPWAPLRLPVFRALWTATVVSNIGTWMHDVGAAWLMMSLSPSPLMVSLVQAATTLPMFLFALPAGVLADIVDRRRLLLFAQIWMLVAAALLGGLQVMGLVTPPILLLFTFALGFGAALNAPPFQAIVSELVPKGELPAAVALNSLGINIARAIGPAVGGGVVAALGPAAVFILNAVSVLGVLIVLLRWRRDPRAGTLPPERFFGAVRAGFRFVREVPAIRTVLVRAGAFFLFASATWALLPLVARQELGLSAGGYGILLAFIGAGAVLGALMLPRVRGKVSANGIVAGATVLFAAVALALAHLRNVPLLCAVMILAGVGWIAMLSTLNVAAQMALPNWVKARVLAVYLVIFNGGMAVGSTLWGTMASRFGVPLALIVAVIGLVLALILVHRRRLPDEVGNLTPSLHWPTPVVAQDPDLERGPVLITVEYQVPPNRAAEFVLAMEEMRHMRRRDGAFSWGLFEDTARPGCWLETFEVETWVEHLRQHERVTHADREVQERVNAFHIGADGPTVAHLLAPDRGALWKDTQP